MKIELKIHDIEMAATAINNTGAAYERLLHMINVGVDLPTEFHKLYEYSYEELQNHVAVLKSIMKQLDNLEEVKLC